MKALNFINDYYSYLLYEVQPEMQEVNEERKERGDLTYPTLSQDGYLMEFRPELFANQIKRVECSS